MHEYLPVAITITILAMPEEVRVVQGYENTTHSQLVPRRSKIWLWSIQKYVQIT